MSFPLDDYPSDRVVLNGGRIVEESILDPDLAADVRASMEEWGEKSCLSVPISFNDEPVGMLVLIETERERRFSAKEIDLARGLGEQAAAAIHHARLYRRERSQNDRLLALLESSRVLAGSLDVTKVLDELRAGAAGLFGAQHVDVDVALARATTAATCPSRRRSRKPRTATTTPTSRGRPCSLDDLSAQGDGTRRTRPGELRRSLPRGGPLVLQGEAQGFVDVRLKGGHELGHDEMGLLQILAGQTAAAIVNARLYRTIERQAITDGLTGPLQPPLLLRAPQPGVRARPALRPPAVAADDRHRRLQALQRPLRSSRRRPRAGGGRPHPHRAAAPGSRPRGALRRRGVRRPPAQHAPRRRPGRGRPAGAPDRRPDARRSGAAPESDGRAHRGRAHPPAHRRRRRSRASATGRSPT